MASLLSEHFLSEVYGNRSYSFTDDAFGAASALDWTDINSILENHWHDPTVVRLVNDNKPVLSSEYVKPRRWRGKLEVADFYKNLKQGASIVVEDVAAWQPSLLNLALQFEAVLHEPVETQLFISGPYASGFGLHWDPYDVFAVQLLGQRRWKLYGRTRESPLLVDKAAPDSPDLELVEQVELHEGDTLYVPRGWWHDAGVAKQPSAHLTLVVPKRTGVDFLAWLGEEIRADSVARLDLPRFGNNEQREVYADALRELIAQNVTPEKIAEFLSLQDRYADATAAFSLPWVLGQKPYRLQNVRVINLVPRAELVSTEKDVHLLADGTSYTFELSARSALYEIFTRNNDMLASDVGGLCDLSDQELLGLLEELQRSGLVATVPSDGSDSGPTDRSYERGG
jgi:hypothetical protein